MSNWGFAHWFVVAVTIVGGVMLVLSLWEKDQPSRDVEAPLPPPREIRVADQGVPHEWTGWERELTGELPPLIVDTNVYEGEIVDDLPALDYWDRLVASLRFPTFPDMSSRESAPIFEGTEIDRMFGRLAVTAS